jgi:3-hydroxymyristoyl/3-hydroxydecanoyl-(acyl carrier protein) dehydratase
MNMTFEEVKANLKQRFPFIMVDQVLELEPGKRIKTLKNVAAARFSSWDTSLTSP